MSRNPNAGHGSAVFSPAVRWLVVVAAGVALSGCASTSENAAAVARGHALAERNCGGCHGMGPTDASTFPDAPPFRNMTFDVNAISYDRALARWHLGRIDMPPAELSSGDLSDVAAYVRSLKSTGKP
jgi:mono/diheme cytochrome c family protein